MKESMVSLVYIGYDSYLFCTTLRVALDGSQVTNQFNLR